MKKKKRIKDECTTVSGQNLTHRWSRNTSYLFPGSSQPLQRQETPGFNQRLKSVGRDNPKIPPERTLETQSWQVLGLLLWQRSEETVEEAELLVIWASGENKAVSQQESNSPERYSRCTSIGFNEESSFDQLVTPETDSSRRERQSALMERETALRERRLWGWAKWGLISSKQMGTLRRRGSGVQDLTCPYVPLIRIRLELRENDDIMVALVQGHEHKGQ